MKRRFIARVSSVLLASCLVGCAAVKPWQRERLADPTMSFNEQGASSNELIYESREGSSGGSGKGGGGCACKR